MRFEAFVASRYLRGKRKSRFVSLITLISVAGVSVGVMALIVVMSVMTGFDNELRSSIIGNRSHLQVYQWHDEPMSDPDAVIAELKAQNPEIVAASPIVELFGLLKSEGSSSQAVEPARIVGIDVARETEITQFADNLTTKNGRNFGRGEPPGDKEIVLGYQLATKLRVGIGDLVGVMTAQRKGGLLRARPTTQWLTVSGISQAQMADFDALYAFVDLKTAELIKNQEGVDGIHCKLTDPYLAPVVGKRIEETLDSDYRTVTWYQSEQAFFEALQQEKVVMFIILVFIILVAAFNITSTLIMVVMEKRRDIGILRTIGVSGGSVLRLFMLEGLYIGLTGTFAGVVLGTLFAYNLNPIAKFVARLLGVDLFNSQIYYFDRIPAAVMWTDIAWITISAVALTFLSTLYPAWSASRVDPVDALRYE